MAEIVDLRTADPTFEELGHMAAMCDLDAVRFPDAAEHYIATAAKIRAHQMNLLAVEIAEETVNAFAMADWRKLCEEPVRDSIEARDPAEDNHQYLYANTLGDARNVSHRRVNYTALFIVACALAGLLGLLLGHGGAR